MFRDDVPSCCTPCCGALSSVSAGAAFCWTSSLLASIGADREVLMKATGVWEEESLPCHLNKCQYFPELQSLIFFWRSNKIHYGNCVRLPGNSVKIGKETSSVMKMRVFFLLCPLCDLVAKHPQTRNIPQWFSQKPCKNQLSSLLITQA